MSEVLMAAQERLLSAWESTCPNPKVVLSAWPSKALPAFCRLKNHTMCVPVFRSLQASLLLSYEPLCLPNPLCPRGATRYARD
jgi:hypothetical protein